jgi:hypothetical protein
VGAFGTLDLEAREELALSRHRLITANIHPETKLATDYLNHFNEVVMLIDMLPSMPECAPDVVAWLPRSYVDHFHMSQFKERELAVQAYATADPDRLIAFERTIRGIDRAIADIQTLISIGSMSALPLPIISDLSEMRLKPLLVHAMGLINGAPVTDHDNDMEDPSDAQSAVDAVFAPQTP